MTLQKSWRLLVDLVIRPNSASIAAKRETLLNGAGVTPASQSKQLFILFVNGMAMMASFTLFNLGLKNCGPIRAILMEFADSFLLAIPSLLCGFTSIPSVRRRGLILVTVAVLLLLFSQEPGAHHDQTAAAVSADVAALASSTVPITTSQTELTSNEMLQANINTAAAAAAVAATAPSQHTTRVLGVFDLSEGAIGMGALLLSTTLSTLRRSYERLESREFGGRKRLHAVSMFLGSVALLPTIGILAFFNRGVEEVATTVGSSAVDAASAAAATAAAGIEEIGFFGAAFTIAFLVIFYVVLQFYIDAFTQKSSGDSQLLIKVNLLVSFIFAAVVDMWRGEGRLTIPTVGAASILFFGVHFIVQSNRSNVLGSPTGGSGGLMPMYATPAPKANAVGHGLTGLSMRELKMMFKHFMSDRTSMRIFIFLTINFLFMFVELIYGWYSNSLGLISDAGHMLFGQNTHTRIVCNNETVLCLSSTPIVHALVFASVLVSLFSQIDCTALAIGLYASFVSKLKPNQLYTYGYGRYEIISGYTNAVFLLFIGYFIFVESVERLFTPPEITSDSLVLVSVLGLCVNIVGLIFFHDHGSHGHSHGGGGGHGHSHGGGGGHGHSHGGNDHGHSHGGSSCSGDHGHEAAGSKAAAAEAAHHNSNMFAIYLHIMADALGSVGVIISSILVKYKGWTSADAICSIIISVLIVASVIPLIQSTLDTLNQRIPVYKEPAIRDTLRRLSEELDGVIAYREPHFWAFSDSEMIGTIHVHVREDVDEQRMLQQISELFKSSGLGISNLSIQLEKDAFIRNIENELKIRPFLTAGQL